MIHFNTENKRIKELIEQRKENHYKISELEFEKFNELYGIERKKVGGTSTYIKNDFFNFEDEKKEFIFTTFHNKTFGKCVAIHEDEFLKVSGKHITYNRFINCRFSNIIFENCTFWGCEFLNCLSISSGVIFKNCSFSIPLLRDDNLPDVENHFTVFKKFNGSVKFIGCRLEDCMAINCAFIHSQFVECDMNNMIIDSSIFFGMNIRGCDMRGTKISNPRCKDFVIEDDDKVSKFNKETFLGKVRVEDPTYDDSFRVYQSFSEQFRKNNFMDLYGEYFYLYKRNELKELNGMDKIQSLFALITFGYGERAMNTILCILFIMVVSPIAFMIFGMNFSGELLYFKFTTDVENMLTIGEWFKHYFRFFEYSFSVLFNINFGNNNPVGFSVCIYYLEKLIGFILVGLFIATLTRKMAR